MSTFTNQALVRANEKFRTLVWPVVGPLCFPGWELRQVEMSNDRDMKQLDMSSGIDVLLFNPVSRNLVGLSVRVRNEEWSSFTIRDSEYKARLAAIKDEVSIRPAYHLQAHVVGGRLVSFGLIKMGTLIKYLEDHGGLTPRHPLERKSNGPGDSDFLAIGFTYLRHDDVSFDQWTEKNGLRKKDPKPAPKPEPVSIDDLFT